MSEKVYVAGAITGCRDESKQWRTKWREKLENAGFNVFDPLLEFDSDEDNSNLERTIVHKDIRRILTSNIIIVNGNTPSWGSAMEIVYSRTFHNDVYTIYDGKKVPIWLNYHSDKCFKDLDSFINYYEVIKNNSK